MLGRTDSARRLLILLVVFALAGGALLVRLGYWQLIQRSQLVDAADRQLAYRTEVPSKRGDIYDRSGTVLLAQSIIHDRLIVAADHLTPDQLAAMVAFLSEQLGLDPTASDALRLQLAAAKPYNVVAKDITPTQADQIRAGAALAGITGISFETTAVRNYPQAGGGPNVSLASHLLGFVNAAGAGQYGVEQYYQDQLAGTPEIVEADKDANGQPIMDTEHVVQAGAPGEDLRLTIDASLQLAMEQEVMAAQIADRADSVSAIVMDPYTGEIYGDASYPAFDGNDYGATASDDPSQFMDPVVSQVYEPGSVFKLFTVIAGLETGTTNLLKTYRDPGYLSLDGGRAKVLDSDRKGMGTLKLQDGIAYSRNVVAAQVALHLAPTTAASSQILHSVWDRFGFGARTGIDLSGEVPGIVNDPAIRPWRQIDLANGAFGQGVAVTPIQLITAYAAILNGGNLVQPHIVAAMGGQAVQEPSPTSVLAPSMSPVLQDLMHHVLQIPWYKSLAQVPGYDVGGKTGTAQIWDPVHHRFYPNKYNFSCVGFIARTPGHPDLVIAIQIHGGVPNRNGIGQILVPIASTELFRRVATDAITTPGLVPVWTPATATPSDAPAPSASPAGQ